MDISTKDMSREQWLEERKKGIGGSDGAAILGLNPYKSADQVYGEKMDEIPPLEDNEILEAGRRMEPVIAEWYADREGKRIANVNRILVHPEYPFIRANVDRRIVGEKRVLECKNVGEWAYRLSEWGEEYTDQVPEYYYIQGHHYTLFPQFANGCDLAAIVGGNRLRVYRFEYDAEIAEMMVEAYAQFWNNLQRGIRPEPQNLEDLKRRWTETVDDAVEATPEIELASKRLAAIKRGKKALDEKEEELKVIIQRFMAEHALLTVGGKKAHQWKYERKPVFDRKGLQRDYPEIFEQYYDADKTTRVFR